jgi:prepilin-type processing-associated H-X9-DG protein
LFCREHYGSPALESATDGASNTILLGEVVTASNLNQNSGTSGALKGSVASIKGWNNAPNDLPKTCADTRTAGNNVGNGANVDCNSIGTRWGDAWDAYVVFSTVLPPNSPSCGGQEAVSYWSEQALLVSLSSFHTGSANVAFADGSVHVLSETVSCETAGTSGLNHRCADSEVVKTGQSPYGIIGALGSTNGGESAALP